MSIVRSRKDNKCVVVLSGGQDSTACLYWALERYDEVHAITFDYGQRHSIELQSAHVICALAEPDSHEVIKLGDGILTGTSPLVSQTILEQYENHDSLPGGLEKTFVPMRNQLFLTIAANRAYVLGCNTVITGVSNEDFGGYPDCRPDFIEALVKASSLGTFTGTDGELESLRIICPLMSLTKRQTVELCLKLGSCYEATAFTHTAYDGLYPPMGSDHASLLRAKGFLEADVPDPLVLRAYINGKMTLPDFPNYHGPLFEEYLNRVITAIAVYRLAVSQSDIIEDKYV